MAQSFAAPTVWGVTGLGAGPSTTEGSNEVSAFAEGNGIVYVGGNFLAVQRTSGGSGKVTQPYLPAFDVRTGEWISSFRPTFNNQVKALAVLPNGRLAVGGYFSTVNGASRRAFVVLDPNTGATDASYTTKIFNNISGGVPVVRRGLHPHDRRYRDIPDVRAVRGSDCRDQRHPRPHLEP